MPGPEHTFPLQVLSYHSHGFGNDILDDLVYNRPMNRLYKAIGGSEENPSTTLQLGTIIVTVVIAGLVVAGILYMVFGVWLNPDYVSCPEGGIRCRFDY